MFTSTLRFLPVVSALVLIGCGDSATEAHTLMLSFHGNDDGTIAIRQPGAPSGELAVGPKTIDGVERYGFRVENEDYTVAGHVPMRWEDGKPNELVIDTSQSAGSARYDFRITADEGIRIARNEVPDSANVMDTEGEWQLVSESFTFSRGEAP